MIVTRGPGTIGPDPRKIEPQVIVIAEEYQPFPQELYGHGLHAVVSPLVLDPDNVGYRTARSTNFTSFRRSDSRFKAGVWKRCLKRSTTATSAPAASSVRQKASCSR